MQGESKIDNLNDQKYQKIIVKFSRNNSLDDQNNHNITNIMHITKKYIVKSQKFNKSSNTVCKCLNFIDIDNISRDSVVTLRHNRNSSNIYMLQGSNFKNSLPKLDKPVIRQV